MHIADHLYLVTGASSGLGHATATHLSSLGASLALFDLNSSVGQELAQELGNARFWEVDCGDSESVEKGFEGVREWVREKGLKWGGVVHSAGVGMVGKVRLYLSLFVVE